MDLEDLVKKHKELQQICSSFHPEIKCWIRDMEGQQSLVTDDEGDISDELFGRGAVGVIIKLPPEVKKDENRRHLLLEKLQSFDYVVQVLEEIGVREGAELKEAAPGVLDM